MAFSFPLLLAQRETFPRRGEPVTVGLPFARGELRELTQLRLRSTEGVHPLQSRVLDLHPDGSVAWCLVDFQATTPGPELTLTLGDEAIPPAPPLQITPFQEGNDHGFDVDTGSTKFRIITEGTFPRFPLLGTLSRDGLLVTECQLEVRENYNLRGSLPAYPLKVETQVSESGPLRVRVDFQIELANPLMTPHEPARSSESNERSVSQQGPLSIFGHLDFYAGLPVVGVQIAIENSDPAGHPGGNWDLGNSGSRYLERFVLSCSLRHPEGAPRVTFSESHGEPFQSTGDAVTIHQGSSGGQNRQGQNHLDRHRQIAATPFGARLTIDGAIRERDRATPIVCLERGGRTLGFTMPRFWENFPKETSADPQRIHVSLFPEGETELQGGERKTHRLTLAFGKDSITEEPLLWCRSPLQAIVSPSRHAEVGTLAAITPVGSDIVYERLVRQALDGDDTFVAKREKIDEYGWRHFGDIYGDHEAVLHTGPELLVSHYNNQYDCVLAFFAQFFRSGDISWLEQGIDCAAHVRDIDVYHTTRDKSAYNGGMFWHTYHYAAADTGTHRTYPKSLRQGPQASLTTRSDERGATTLAEQKKAYAVGGGPSASHNYNTGLMMAYFLTGDESYRETALDLANFVIRMDDPWTTPFRFLSLAATGAASESGGGGYHGPGRASANSVLALLTGYRLSGEPDYLAKAEELIVRVVHPCQNLEALDLGNAELRWFYVMFLQALGTYLDLKISIGQLDRMYAYGQLTLLHYARWMLQNERPILDQADRLQFPNETWAAQDMRKVEVFQFAAKHAQGPERLAFLDKAEWFFRYVETTLDGFATKSLCRPVILLMNYGWTRCWWRENAASPASFAPQPNIPVRPEEFGSWSMFVPQKVRAIRRAKIILAGSGVLFVVALLVTAIILFK